MFVDFSGKMKPGSTVGLGEDGGMARAHRLVLTWSKSM